MRKVRMRRDRSMGTRSLVRVCVCVYKSIKVKTSGKSVSFLTGFLILYNKLLALSIYPYKLIVS